MNILYLAHRVPFPPHTGDRVRSFHQIRHLARGHRIHLACLVDDRSDGGALEAMGRYCVSVCGVPRSDLAARWAALAAVVRGGSLSVAAFYSRELRRRILAMLRTTRPDRIVVFSSAMAEYVRDIADVPRLMDFVDVDSEKWRLFAQRRTKPLAWLYYLEAERLARYEEAIATTFDQSIVVSERELASLRARVGDVAVSVVPNGVDLGYFRPAPPKRVPERPVIVFTGAMDYFPNVDAVEHFCDAIFPHVRRAVPAAQFVIVGRRPTGRVRRLGTRPGVTVTGAVPDVRPYLAEAWIAVAPLRMARGVQNKVLEAMATGLPVVGSAEAFQGTSVRETDGVRLADDPATFAARVVDLLDDVAVRSEYGQRARAFVEQHHRWDTHGEQLETLLEAAGTSGLLTPLRSGA